MRALTFLAVQDASRPQEDGGGVGVGASQPGAAPVAALPNAAAHLRAVACTSPPVAEFIGPKRMNLSVQL